MSWTKEGLVSIEAAPIIPEDSDAERSVLGAILLDNRLLPEAAVLPLKAFATPFHQKVLAGMLELAKQEAPIDPITLRDVMSPEDYDGPRISALIDTMPRLDNLGRYVDQVHRKYIVREAMRVATRAMHTLRNPEADVATVQEMISKLSTIADAGAKTDTVIEVMDIAPAWAMELESKANEGPKDALSTGYRKLDRNLGGGFYKGELVVIGGRPGYGKTALMLTLALQMARRGTRVHFVSLEMSKPSLMDRAVAQTIRVDSRLLRSGEVNPEQLKMAYDAAMNIGALPLTINDERKRSPTDVLAEVRRLHRDKGGVDVVVLDYIGLLRYKSRDLRIEMGEALKDIRGLGAEQGTVMIVGAQLNRQADGLKEGKRPKLSDFRESGDLEQDADVVIMPWRNSYEPGAIQVEMESDASLLIAKQRNGPTGEIGMEYFPRFTLYRERS